MFSISTQYNDGNGDNDLDIVKHVARTPKDLFELQPRKHMEDKINGCTEGIGPRINNRTVSGTFGNVLDGEITHLR